MRSPDPIDERDLDVAGLRRSLAQEPSRKIGSSGTRRRGLRTYLLGGLVALVLILFGSVVWMAYQDMMPGDGTPPLIRAEAGQIKREPEERGGLPLLNEESVVVQALDEPEEPVRVERIVPRQAEAPRSTADVIPEALQAEPGAKQESDSVVASTQSPETTSTGESDSLDSLLAEIASGLDEEPPIEPAAGRVEQLQLAANDSPTGDTLTTPAEDEPKSSAQLAPPATLQLPSTAPSVTDAATAAPPTSGEPASQTAAPRVAEPAPAGAPASAPEPPVAESLVAAETPRATAATTATEAPARPATPVPPASPATTPRPVLAASFDGAYRVQLLAVRDEASAAGAWSGLQQRHQAVLGPLRSNVQRADVGDATFYRLQAGPFADRSGASSVCEALQAEGADCFVVEPTS